MSKVGQSDRNTTHLVFVEHGVFRAAAGCVKDSGHCERSQVPQTESRSSAAHQPVVLVERHTTEPLAQVASSTFLTAKNTSITSSINLAKYPTCSSIECKIWTSFLCGSIMCTWLPLRVSIIKCEIMEDVWWLHVLRVFELWYERFECTEYSHCSVFRSGNAFETGVSWSDAMNVVRVTL